MQMLHRVALTACVLAGLGTEAGAAPAAHSLIYEAVGPQAPQREVFEVSAAQVLWRSDDGSVRARLDRRSGRLRWPTTDPQTAPDEPPGTAPVWPPGEARDGLQALQSQLQALRAPVLALPAEEREAARRRLQELFELRGPWAALEPAQAGDLRLVLPSAAQPPHCRAVLLHVGPVAVARLCDLDANTVPGGPEVVGLLQAMATASDAWRDQVPDPWPLVWAVHPLVTAARDGRLPLELVQVLPGEPAHGLRLLRKDSASADQGHRPGR